MGGEQLKRVPKPWDDSHPRADLLRNRGLIAWRLWPASEPWLGTAAAKDRIVTAIGQSAPLRDWLRLHVGPTTLEQRRRPGG